MHPVMSGGPPDKIEPIFVQIEENRITDHVSIMIACDKLLGFVNFEVLEVVYAEIGEQLECVRTFDIEIRHMKRLFEENAGLPPGTLLISPVREFGSLQSFFQALIPHSCSKPPFIRRKHIPYVAESTLDLKLTQGDVLDPSSSGGPEQERRVRLGAWSNFLSHHGYSCLQNELLYESSTSAPLPKCKAYCNGTATRLIRTGTYRMSRRIRSTE